MSTNHKTTAWDTVSSSSSGVRSWIQSDLDSWIFHILFTNTLRPFHVHQCAAGTKLQKAPKEHRAHPDPSVQWVCAPPDCSLWLRNGGRWDVISPTLQMKKMTPAAIKQLPWISIRHMIHNQVTNFHHLTSFSTRFCKSCQLYISWHAAKWTVILWALKFRLGLQLRHAG